MACCKPCHGIGVNWTPGTATLGSLDSVSKLKSLLTLSYLATEKYLEVKMQSHSCSWLRTLYSGPAFGSPWLSHSCWMEAQDLPRGKAELQGVLAARQTGRSRTL